MKANSLRWLLLFFVASAVLRLPAQQSEADRKLVADIRAKAQNGDAIAQLLLGCCYSKGQGVVKDEVEAVKWFRKAAEQNLREAQHNLGCCYAEGQGVTKDYVEAVSWYRKAAEQDDSWAESNLGYCYESGQGVATDKVEAVNWYRKAAQHNEAVAQYNLGLCCVKGQGVAKNDVEAVKWFRKAAEQNHAGAQYNLGFCYAKGQGVPADEVEAVKWYRKAAEQNDAWAESNLGYCYESGQGVAKDEVEAVNWYREAAERNNAVAQYNLGSCYYSGQGVAKDEAAAVKWWRKAAEQDHAGAQYNLGFCCAKGQGVAKDAEEAVKWYRKAAEQNEASAQYNLGLCYFKGQGTAKNDIEAYKWWLVAKANGDEHAKNYLPMLEREMSPDQIAKGQDLAGNFKPQETPSSEGAGSSSSMADMRPAASGTGFFITEDGLFVTSEHVVKNATQFRLVTPIGLISAKLVKVDVADDLALLKTEGKFAALPVAASRAVRLGNTVATVGFPNIGLQGFAPKLAKGEIASLSGAQDDPRYFQISVPVQPGNSGGALVDERGNVVGVVLAKLSARAALATSGAWPENVNYAVKSSFLLSFLESVPEVAAKLREPNTKERKFEDVVKSAEQAAVLVLVH